MAQNIDLVHDPALLVPHLKVRDQSIFKNKKGAVCIVYIDARAAAEILDAALGIGGWSFEFHTIPTKTNAGYGAVGRLTLHIEQPNGTYRDSVHEDFGSNGDAGKLETGAKGAASDSLKRCAAQIGVGRALYALSQRFARENDIEPYRDKHRVKHASLDRLRREWQKELEEIAEKWRADRKIPEAPPVDIPEGFEVDPDTGEVREIAHEPAAAPAPKAADLLAELVAMGPEDVVKAALKIAGFASAADLLADGAMERAREIVAAALRVDTPPADAAPEAAQAATQSVPTKILDQVAQEAGAPGPGSKWGERWSWLLTAHDDDEGLAKAVIAETGITPVSKSRLGNDDVWMGVLVLMQREREAKAA